MTTRKQHPFAGAKKMKPTKGHRPAIWENILGTVYAMNESGDIQYFDYRWEEARSFAGVHPDRDLRVARFLGNVSYGNGGRGMPPRKGQFVLWVKKE